MCFTYGTWFGCCALASVGEGMANSSHARAACAFLLGKQRADGGWGESYLSCQDKASALPVLWVRCSGGGCLPHGFGEPFRWEKAQCAAVAAGL